MITKVTKITKPDQWVFLVNFVIFVSFVAAAVGLSQALMVTAGLKHSRPIWRIVSWMRHRVLVAGLWALLAVSASGQQRPPGTEGLVSPCPGCGYPPTPIDDADRAGWTALFDGRSLDGWDGNPDVWSVADGAITAESTAARRIGSTYLIWKGGEPRDFELSLEMKAGTDIHSGVFYRGRIVPLAARPGAPQFAVPANPKWNVAGYSLDFDYPLDNVGNVQDTTRAEPQIGWRGYAVRMEAGRRPRVVGVLGDRDAMKAVVKQGEWNRLHIVARGGTITHVINGQVMAVLIDDDATARKSSGVIALQMEQYGIGRVSFRNIWLKQQ